MCRFGRRQFTRQAGLAFLSGVSVTLGGCGGGGGDGSYSTTGPTTSTPPPAAPGDEIGEVSANHGHEAVITAAELMAGGDLQLDIAGSAGHSHLVTLPAEAVVEIRDGKAVRTDSTSTDAHSHMVTFNAESPAPPTDY